VREPTRVKICGITNEEDAAAAIDAGADALGFNLYPGSKRCVHIEDVARWLPTLRGGAIRVAVMVNPTLDEVRRVQTVFDAIQLHGAESEALCAAAASTGRIWKAFPLTKELDGDAMALFEAEALVIDSAVPGAFGGTGKPNDLALAARLVAAYTARPIWLSGGLSPGNVAQALFRVHPYGVDVASGVEAPGNSRRKDASRMRAFIEAAKGAGA
jgi:phosphoribosylanthranilate isomerase